MRRGIAEFVADPAKHYKPADITASAEANSWAALYLKADTPEEVAKSGEFKMTKGSLDDLKAVMDLYDKFDPAKNFKIPMTNTDFKKKIVYRIIFCTCNFK